MLIIVFISLGSWSLVWIHNDFSHFKSEAKSVRSNHIKNQKEHIKSQVEGAVRYINEMHNRSEEHLNELLKKRVYEAHTIATHIYQKNIGATSSSDVQEMIKDALRPIRFLDGRGYFFAVSLDGIEQLYPVNPEFEGKNVLDLQDAKGNFVIRDEINVLKDSGEGFVKHFWAKPMENASETHLKISFVKYFKPLNWYIGTGEYVAEAQKTMQVQVLEHLIRLHFGKEGYLFGSTYVGESLFSNGKITIGSGNIWNLTDPNGVKIIQEQSKTAQTVGGGFVEYSWRKLKHDAPSPKISFVKGIPEWGWTIGAGVYLDTIESEINNKKAILLKKLKGNVFRSIIIFVILICCIFFWYVRTSKQIKQSTNSFVSFLKKARTESVIIDPDAIQIKEFKEIAVSTNRMLEDRISAEEAYKKSEENFRALADTSPLAIYMSSGIEQKAMYINPTFINLFGYTINEVPFVEQWWPLAYPDPNYRKQVVEEWQKKVEHAIETESEIEQMEVVVTCKDGSTKDISWGFITIGEQNWAFGLDLTERKRAEKEREKLQIQLSQAHKIESIGTLTGGVAHDFNNILNVILGHSELALSDLPESNPAYKNIKKVRKAGFKAADIVRQLLSFSRNAEQEFRASKLSLMVIDSLKFFRSLIPSNIEIKKEFSAKNEIIFADPVQINQIVMNLFINASQEMKSDGGVIKICIEDHQIDESTLNGFAELKGGLYVKMTVTDTGSGIDPQFIDRIFDPYFTTKDIGEGSGMGLSVVHGIVKAHNGVIKVSSKLGKGTEFKIFFPVIEEKPHFDKKSEDKTFHGHERILLVDDDKTIAEMTKESLERIGFKVETRFDPLEAIKLFESESENFDLVITDMTMPNLTGEKLAERLFKIKANIPIIICTGYSSIIDDEKAKQIGVAGFLMKPVTLSILSKTIRKILG